jgi:hypothetical protein
VILSGVTQKACVLVASVMVLAGCLDDGSSDDGGPTPCVGGEFCLGDQECVDGFCVPGSGESSGDGDGDTGDGDGDTGDGDGDGGSGDGDGDGDSGDGDPCMGSTVQLFNQPALDSMPFGAVGGIGLVNYLRPADDFTVPEGDQCWCVQKIVVYGTLDGAFHDGIVEFRFYGGDSLPQEPQIYTDSGPTEAAGDFDYLLFPGVVLPAGHYWLAVAPLLNNSLDQGVWYWQEAAAGSGFGWALDTDYDGNPCANQGWTAGSNCGGWDPGNVAFELHGVVGGGACP